MFGAEWFGGGGNVRENAPSRIFRAGGGEGARVVPLDVGTRANFGTVLAAREATYEVVLDSIPEPGSTIKLGIHPHDTIVLPAEQFA